MHKKSPLTSGLFINSHLLIYFDLFTMKTVRAVTIMMPRNVMFMFLVHLLIGRYKYAGLFNSAGSGSYCKLQRKNRQCCNKDLDEFHI